MISGVPVGTVMPYVGRLKQMQANLEQAGWLYCNGDTLEQAIYPDLFEAIGVTFGGDGPHFKLPDFRGMFLRAVDDGKATDPDAKDRINIAGVKVGDASAGTVQHDAIRSHEHTWRGYYHTTWDGDSERHCLSQDYEAGEQEVSFQSKTPGNETRPINMSVWYIIKAKP